MQGIKCFHNEQAIDCENFILLKLCLLSDKELIVTKYVLLFLPKTKGIIFTKGVLLFFRFFPIEDRLVKVKYIPYPHEQPYYVFVISCQYEKIAKSISVLRFGNKVNPL